MKLRKEFDSIGKISVPNDKYWGASTQRSKKYFDIGEFLVRPILIKSIAIIKKAAATVHSREKQIAPKIAKAIIKRHKSLAEFFSLFGLNDEETYQDIEGIEHHMNQKTLKTIQALTDELQRQPALLERVKNKVSTKS